MIAAALSFNSGILLFADADRPRNVVPRESRRLPSTGSVAAPLRR